MKILLILLYALILAGCATGQAMKGTYDQPVTVGAPTVKEFDTIPPPALGKVVVAVYNFTDKTGQRRPSDTQSSFSTAVTQGADAFLIKALKDVGNSGWFEVVERGGLASLTQERQIIRQMREAYDGPDAKKLMPMKFAGMLIEGGITGYDTSTRSGGMGMRVLGIGPQTQFSEDIITVSLRAVSVNTGSVLAAVNVQKTVYSTADSIAVLKFFDNDTQVFEFESGITLNEPATLAVKTTVEAAVVELIKEGELKDVWDFAYEPINSKETKE
jgi:curli production assembly/transport component CsgG